jgi:hypothetical protein
VFNRFINSEDVGWSARYVSFLERCGGIHDNDPLVDGNDLGNEEDDKFEEPEEDL